MKIDMEFQEERRDQADFKMAKYQQDVKEYHDVRVCSRYFQVGDQVLKRRGESEPLQAEKFTKNCEGRYVMTSMIKLGTYKFQTLVGYGTLSTSCTSLVRDLVVCSRK